MADPSARALAVIALIAAAIALTAILAHAGIAVYSYRLRKRLLHVANTDFLEEVLRAFPPAGLQKAERTFLTNGLNLIAAGRVAGVARCCVCEKVHPNTACEVHKMLIVLGEK